MIEARNHMIENIIIIETDRLVLRRFCKDDLQDLYEYLSDEPGRDER